MKTIALVAVLGLAIGGTAFAQAPGSTQSPAASPPASTQPSASASTAAAPGNAPAQGGIAQGTAITADLARGLDTKKAKEGDQIQAKVAQDVLSAGKVVLPRNSKLIGHVTEVKAGGKGEPSSLGIAFDKAVLKDGREIPVHGVIQALAPPPRASSAPGGGAFPSDEGGGAAMGGAGAPAGGYSPAGGMGNAPIGGAPAAAPVGGTAGAATGAANGVGANTTNGAGEPNPTNQVGMTTSGRLTAGSRGVMGMPGVTIDAGGSNATNATVVTNENRNVKLDGGTQLVLRVTTQ